VFWVLMTVAAAAGDDELVLRLRRRDPQAVAELYDRYGGLVYSLILRVVRDTGVAEDLVQETFLRAWSRAGGFDSGRGPIGPWLLAIARNRAIDYTRSPDGKIRNGLDLERAEHSFRCPDVEKDILLSDGARRVRAAMSVLPPQQREAIELAYFEGLSQSEMAERMGQPLGTVKTWVRTALQSLRAKLGVAV
jgi:RNA polymerase sigma-70 factor, ECF subfamily